MAEINKGALVVAGAVGLGLYLLYRNSTGDGASADGNGVGGPGFGGGAGGAGTDAGSPYAGDPEANGGNMDEPTPTRESALGVDLAAFSSPHIATLSFNEQQASLYEIVQASDRAGGRTVQPYWSTSDLLAASKQASAVSVGLGGSGQDKAQSAAFIANVASPAAVGNALGTIFGFTRAGAGVAPTVVPQAQPAAIPKTSGIPASVQTASLPGVTRSQSATTSQAQLKSTSTPAPSKNQQAQATVPSVRNKNSGSDWAQFVR